MVTWSVHQAILEDWRIKDGTDFLDKRDFGLDRVIVSSELQKLIRIECHGWG
jgi:hypothetical protein